MADNVKKWIIAISIAIVFNMFVNYGISTFQPGPQYEDFCGENKRPHTIPLEKTQDCEVVDVSSETRNACSDTKGYIAYNYDSNGCATEAYCETCSVNYDKVRKDYDSNVFIVLLLVAVASLAAGLRVRVAAVSTGFLLAGVLGILIASTRYWGHLQNLARFLLLGAVLAVLIWFGYKKVK